MSVHRRLMMQRYGLEHSTFLYSPVVFDPIFTPMFIGAGLTGGFTIGAATISYASIASAIATTALSIGIQAIMAPKPPKPEDGRAPMTQAIPYRTWGVGTTRIAGALMLFEAVGSNLFEVQALCGHPITQIRRYFLHDDAIEPGDIDGAGQTPVVKGRYGPGRVWLWSRLGANPETPYTDFIDLLKLATGNPSQDFWTSAHRGDGQASVALVAQSTSAKNQNKSFPYGAPRVSVEADLAKVWDFRDVGQDPEDPTTWEFSKNAALIMCWHQCFNEFGHRRDYTKAILPVLDMWKEEADICDENVALNGGGTEKRYECNGWDTAENGPKAATNSILAACDGWICERGDGALLFTVGKFRESRCGSLTDADIVGHQIQHDVLPEDEVNQLVPRFTYPATDYTTSDTDFFQDVPAQVAYGRILRQEVDYTWCHQWRQARRLGIRDWRRLQQKKRGSIDVRFSGINAIYSRWVRLATPKRIPSLSGEIVENRRSVLALMRGGFQMDVIRHPSNIDAWTPATDEGQQPPVPVDPGSGELVVPVINVVQAKPNGNSVYIRVVIIDPENDALTPVVRYRLADNGTGNPGAWVEQEFPDSKPGIPVVGYVELNTNVVPSDKLLEIEVAFKVTNGEYSDWSTTTTVTSTVDPVAPAAPTFTAPLASLTVTPSAKAANDNTRAIVFKRGTSLQTFAAATQLGSDISVFANQTVGPSPSTDTPGYGHWKYWAGSKNGSGVPCVSPASVLVDIYGPELVTNGVFSADANWTKGTGWTIAAGVATKAAGVSSLLSQVLAAPLVTGKIYELVYTITARTAGAVAPSLSGGATVGGTVRNAVGTYTQELTATANHTSLNITADSSFAGSLDNISLRLIS
jgi:hypothetical protein